MGVCPSRQVVRAMAAAPPRAARTSTPQQSGEPPRSRNALRPLARLPWPWQTAKAPTGLTAWDAETAHRAHSPREDQKVEVRDSARRTRRAWCSQRSRRCLRGLLTGWNVFYSPQRACGRPWRAAQRWERLHPPPIAATPTALTRRSAATTWSAPTRRQSPPPASSPCSAAATGARAGAATCRKNLQGFHLQVCGARGFDAAQQPTQAGIMATRPRVACLQGSPRDPAPACLARRFTFEASPFCSYANDGGVHILFAGEVGAWPGVNAVNAAHDGGRARSGCQRACGCAWLPTRVFARTGAGVAGAIAVLLTPGPAHLCAPTRSLHAGRAAARGERRPLAAGLLPLLLHGRHGGGGRRQERAGEPGAGALCTAGAAKRRGEAATSMRLMAGVGGTLTLDANGETKMASLCTACPGAGVPGVQGAKRNVPRFAARNPALPRRSRAALRLSSLTSCSTASLRRATARARSPSTGECGTQHPTTAEAVRRPDPQACSCC